MKQKTKSEGKSGSILSGDRWLFGGLAAQFF